MRKFVVNSQQFFVAWVHSLLFAAVRISDDSIDKINGISLKNRKTP